MNFSQMILQGLDIFETLATNRTGLVTVPIICMGHLKMTFSGAMGCKCLSTNQTLITGDPNGICNVLIWQDFNLQKGKKNKNINYRSLIQ